MVVLVIIALVVVRAESLACGHRDGELFSPLAQRFLPAFFPALQDQRLGLQADALAVSNGSTDRFVVSGLKAEGLKTGQKIEQHVGGEAHVGGGDRQHGRLPCAWVLSPAIT